MITKTNVLAAHRETFGLPTLLSCVSSHELTRIQVKVASEKTCLPSLNLELFYCFVCLSSQAKIRLPGHPWSSKFSLDAVGDSGKVTCKGSDSKRFEVR